MLGWSVKNIPFQERWFIPIFSTLPGQNPKLDGVWAGSRKIAIGIYNIGQTWMAQQLDGQQIFAIPPNIEDPQTKPYTVLEISTELGPFIWCLNVFMN